MTTHYDILLGTSPPKSQLTPQKRKPERNKNGRSSITEKLNLSTKISIKPSRCQDQNTSLASKSSRSSTLPELPQCGDCDVPTGAPFGFKNVFGPFGSSRNQTIRPSQATAYETATVHIVETDTATEKVYHLSSQLLRLESGYFDDLLNDADLASAPTVLSDITIAVFDVVVDWIYGVSLTTATLRDGLSDPQPIQFAIEIYVAAGALEMTGLQNDLIDVLKVHLQTSSTSVSAQALEQCYEQDLESSKLWDFCLRSCVFGIFKNKSLRKIATKAPANMEVDAAIGREMLKYLDHAYQDPKYEKGCEYHDHTDGKVCKASHLN